MHPINRKLMGGYWDKKLMDILYPELKFFDIRVPVVPISCWKKMINWIKWRTVWKFQAWLHRDCGD